MDYSTVPILALSIESKQLLSTFLNPPKILPSDDGWPRDWRGLAYVLDIPGEKIPLLASQQNPVDKILGSLQEKSETKITFKDLQSALAKIDRWDIIDDAEPLFINDAQQYFERIERSKLNPEAVDNNVEAEILTVDDLYRFNKGLEKQFYDAFLLYADEDFEFAKYMLERLEKENLKLCTKDRDLISGVTFEHEAIMQLISERCNRLIVIISPDFSKSPANKFFLTYAHAVGIDKKQRKLIPCIYKECDLPRELSYTNKANYNRRGMYDFWGKLCDSIKAPLPLKSQMDTLVPSTSSDLTKEKGVVKVNLEPSDTNDTKETTMPLEENAFKKNGMSEIDEKLKEVESEPELLECTTALIKSESDKIENKAKKDKESPEEMNNELNSNFVTSLPLPTPLDDVDLVPPYSGAVKNSKFMKSIKKKFTKLIALKAQ